MIFRRLAVHAAIAQVTSVIPSRSNPTRGVVGTDVSVTNQDGDVVLTYHVKRMLKRSDVP